MTASAYQIARQVADIRSDPTDVDGIAALVTCGIPDGRAAAAGILAASHMVARAASAVCEIENQFPPGHADWLEDDGNELDADLSARHSRALARLAHERRLFAKAKARTDAIADTLERSVPGAARIVIDNAPC